VFHRRGILTITAGLLLFVVACTATTQEPESTPTLAPTETSTPEILPEPIVETIDEPTADSHGEENGGLADLVDALHAAGATVEQVGEVDQPFFSVGGQVLSVDGAEVQVFEYPDAAAGEAEAVLISPNASSVGTSMMTWVATPHFYALNRVIVLYVGDDEAVVHVLSQVLGQPVAGGQVVLVPPPDTTALLSDALGAADHEALQGLMGESLIIGYWLSEGQTLTPDQAIEQLRLNLLPNPAGASFIRDRALFPDLGEFDPTTAFGPDVQIVDLVYSQGWGADGMGEAILTIGQNADGRQYWQGIIYDSAGFTPPVGPLKTATLLIDALAAADYDAVRVMMGESFSIGYWLSEGQTLPPDQAIEQLRLNLLPNPAGASFIRDRTLFPDLGDVDPTNVFGPDVQIVDLIYSQGWGAEGLDEAILKIAQSADGTQYWYGILYGRFEGPAEPAVQEPPSYETSVYRNSENGFELDYPAWWHLDEQVLGSRASGALFYLADTDEEPIFSAVVFLWDPKNELDAWLEVRRQSWSDSGATVLSEEELALAGGHRAIQFELEWPGGMTTHYLFTEVGDRYLEIYGHGALEIFGEIIGTLRFVEPGS
jgi:hypothetical protein